jgi:Caenorhabditis protein of unknown function, DUF268
MNAAALFRTVREIGLNPRRFGLIALFPRFWRDLNLWKRQGGRVTSMYPVLTDWSDQAGDASGAYFHQDMLVARRVYEAMPQRHVDVGSRIDGFVAHVAVFRRIDVIDIRPMEMGIRNVRFIQADLMQGTSQLASSTDSLSCLHALEHFGLGRYGDPIDPSGHLKGFVSLIQMLKPGAAFYLSFPIGRPMVEFNAHRVFDSEEVLSWPGSELLRLERFDFVDDDGALHEDIPLGQISTQCAKLRHGCGIYTFTRRG